MIHAPFRYNNWDIPYLLYARLTANQRVLPNVFFLGGTKCGTTSLEEAFLRHPQVVRSAAKELHYLQELPGFLTYYDESWLMSFLWERSNRRPSYSIRGYRKFFCRRRTLEREQRRIGRRIVVADHDPFNLYCPETVRRVESFAVDPKFVIAVRNPITRAFSDYNMHLYWEGANAETRSFEQAIDDELSGRCTNFRLRYLNQSIYAPCIRNWFSAFGRARFLIVVSEELFRDPAAELVRICDFLEIEHISDLPHANNPPYKTKLADTTRERLVDYFSPHNAELRDLIGRDLGWDSRH